MKIRIYQQASPNEVYAIGADCAEGIEEGDSSALFVINNNFQQCASFTGSLDVDRFASLLVKTAKLFNNALLCWEVNSMGTAITSNIKKLNYHNLYRREMHDKHAIDIHDNLGWQTNVRSKRFMIDDLKAVIRDESIKIKDIELLRELSTLTYDEAGNINLNGKDRCVAACLAIQGLKQVPSAVKFVPQFPTAEDKPPTFESFGERMRRLSRKGAVESYFK